MVTAQLQIGRVFLILLLCLPFSLHAQRSAEYAAASQLMQRSEYEQAYEILRELLRNDPSNYMILDQTLTALTELKRYDEAIDLAGERLGNRLQDIVLAARLGELYHLNGEPEKALELWQRTVEMNENSLQAYRYVGDFMRNRREFAAAINLYETARTRFGNPTLFFTEITSGYMDLGQPDRAVTTLIDVLEAAPNNATFIQRQLVGFDDARVTEMAIVDLDERSRRMQPGTPEFIAFRDVSIALLMEAGFFRRALASARSLESAVPEGSWPVYTLAGRLQSQKQYELAEQAYQYYDERQRHPLQARSMEERAVMYLTWSRDLTATNLDYDGFASSLYVRADSLFQQLLELHPNYTRRAEVLVLKSEIALDHLHDAGRAENYLDMLRRHASNPQHEILADYVQGRVHMFRGEHSQARIHLTRANRNARTGEWAERTRYFLALNDFYTGDFEFATIQMRPLERAFTSYYANDALRLRLWIQEGRAEDEPLPELEQYALARFLFDTGDASRAVETLLPLITDSGNPPMRGEALIMAADFMRSLNPRATFAMLNKSVRENFEGPQRERLLWERARIADGMYHQPEAIDATGTDELPAHVASIISWATATDNADCLSPLWDCDAHNQREPRSTTEQRSIVKALYEDLLFEFPLGFYADAVRERLRELEQQLPG